MRSVQHRVDVLFVFFFFLSLRELTILHHLSNRNPLVSPPTSPLPYFIFFGERNFVPGQQLGNYKVLLFVCGSTRVEIIFLYIFFFFNMLKFQKVGGENFFDSLKWTIIFIIFVFFFVFELYRNVSRNFSAKKKKFSQMMMMTVGVIIMIMSVGRSVSST